MTAYYNEHDPFAAAWLRELIKAHLIAPGEVDERDMWDVVPGELVGYDQWHFCAGIGTWSHALRCAGWPDNRPVLTISLPCQSFSAAGKGGGLSDSRGQLAEAFFWIAGVLRPDCILGEQVEAAIKHDWLDVVATHLEREKYAVGAVGFPAAGVGAPHIRQRLYWVAESGLLRQTRSARQRNNHAESAGLDGLRIGIEGRSPTRRVADAEHSERWSQHQEQREPHGRDGLGRPGATNGFWRNAEWLPCRDGKARPVEPGTFPLAHGAAARVGRLRGYGNAIVAPAAEAFIRAFMEKGM
jgi:DNA (cytosine-5)-methyltransferase 1